MMHELASLTEDLENSVQRLAELLPVFALLLELLEDEPTDIALQQARWIVMRASTETDCERDWLYGLAGKLNRLQSKIRSEAS